MIPSTTRMTMTTTAALMIGSGSLNGIAAQLRLPSISTSHLLCRRTPGGTNARLFGTRHCLLDDVFEQLGLDRAVDPRRHGLARLCQFGVGGIVERRAGAARLHDPGVEIAGGHRLCDEPHFRKAVAAEICRKAGILAERVRQQVEVGGRSEEHTS